MGNELIVSLLDTKTPEELKQDLADNQIRLKDLINERDEATQELKQRLKEVEEPFKYEIKMLRHYVKCYEAAIRLQSQK